MELRHLRYFVAVAEECHFGRAAARLHIAQPPLSQQIRQLEADLGVELFTRTTRRVDLTPAGQRYLERARSILAQVAAAGAEAGRVAAGELGRVSLGFTGSATYELLPSLARALRRDLPGIELDLRGEMLTPRQVEALRAGVLDVGFLRPPTPAPDLDLQVLRREALVAAIPAAHPLAERKRVRLRDLADEPFITYPAGQRSAVAPVVLEACAKAGFSPRVVHEVAETSTLMSFVAAGLGVALVPASVQHLQITGAVHLPLTGTNAGVDLAVATRLGENRPDVLRVLARAHRLVGPVRPRD
jgi:DNA-binding transcriptional LysR family regulator